MQKQLNQVRKFREAFYLPCSDEADIDGSVDDLLGAELISEEVDELIGAVSSSDIVEVLDALVDITYLVIGEVHKFGLSQKFEEAFDLVHANNMSKLGSDGKPIYREDGKVLKPEGFKPVNLKQLFEPTTPDKPTSNQITLDEMIEDVKKEAERMGKTISIEVEPTNS